MIDRTDTIAIIAAILNAKGWSNEQSIDQAFSLYDGVQESQRARDRTKNVSSLFHTTEGHS